MISINAGGALWALGHCTDVSGELFLFGQCFHCQINGLWLLLPSLNAVVLMPGDTGNGDGPCSCCLNKKTQHCVQ